MTKTKPCQLSGTPRLLTVCLAVVCLCWGALPQSAKADSFYPVAECAPGHVDIPDATVEGSTTAYSASTSCASGNWLQVQSGSVAPAGSGKRWVLTAPPGTRIERIRADYNLVGDPVPEGNRSHMFIRRYGETQRENLAVVGLGSSAGTYDSAIQETGPFAAVGAGVFCSRVAESCGYAPGQFARLSNLKFLMEDLIPPGTPEVGGNAANGEWVRGTTQVLIGESDIGAGVSRTTVAVGGQHVITDTVCQPGMDDDGYVGSMAPCDPIEMRSIPIDTTASAFKDGPDNDVRFCTHEFGFNSESTCTSKAFKVDNAAPGPPQDLEVAGGEGWRRDNDFDLSWNNPHQDHAPIEAATVKVTGPGGYQSTSTTTGDDIGSIENVSVPGVGTYTAEVFLRDAAGNESPQASASVTLKFDDTVPVVSQPEKANGWISRQESGGGWEQSWQRPRDFEVPPSGIAGYRVAVNAAQDFDPCAGPGDPRACAGPLTEVGLHSNSRLLGPGDLVEGVNWVHVVPVSGSGMRAAEVGRIPLKVDLTDPTAVLLGVPDGWVSRPVELKVRASDSVSGMEDTDEYPGDEPPRTVMLVDGMLHEEGSGAVTARVSGEGVHEIEYWARDLAGNENDGAEGNNPTGTATVRIDSTPPELAFAHRQDPEDPDRLEASVGDQLSGVASGGISYREKGAAAWIPLATRFRRDRLTARVDSEMLERGVAYEFRVQATDRAGNTATSTRRRNGSVMSTVGPFRAASVFTGLRVNGKQRTKVGYGRPITVSGRLVEASGAPVSNAQVKLVETYAPGSRADTRSVLVETDSDGRFSSRMPNGPSRSVVAEYAGDSRRLAAASRKVAVRVRGGVTLRAARRVRAGRRAVFSGKVRAKGADLSNGGKSVEVQVRIGKRWKTVGRSLRSDAKGKFKLRYRFVANYSKPTRYRFRAVVLKERGWPYLPTTSRVRPLVVVP